MSVESWVKGKARSPEEPDQQEKPDKARNVR